MNRLSLKLAAVALAAFTVALAGAPAYARQKQPKHKKNEDLSANPLAGVNTKQPDLVLYDKAMLAMKKGHFDVARLDLQTMLNTYPDSEYRMRAKLAVGDTWFKEGGTAALAQAEAEYNDFITFFPDAPEAAEAKMKVGDIYFQQMEKPDRDDTNALQAEAAYREMINMFPDSPLIPRVKQKLRDVQEVLAERETEIGTYYQSRGDYPAAIARLQTVVDTYPLYSKGDQALLAIGDCFAGQAHDISIMPGLSSALRERLHAYYIDRAVKAYDKVITRYPMAPHVEDARDRLVALNRPIPEPTQAAIAESDAEERSRQPLRFTDRTLGIIRRGPVVVEAVHVGEPSMVDPPRTLASDVVKQEAADFRTMIDENKPQIATTPTTANEPTRSDQPSQVPLQMSAPAGGTGVGAQIVSAPANTADATTNSGLKAVGPTNTVLPPVEAPAEAPNQVNEIKPGEVPAATAQTSGKPKAPKTDLSQDSSSRKKKKKGLGKLNPF